MKRDEAILFLKEVLDKCTLLDGQYFCLTPPNLASKLSKGYQIHMMNPIHSDDLVCMDEILGRHGLLLKIEKDLTIIYKPQKPKR
jgi:hypothetical protein